MKDSVKKVIAAIQAELFAMQDEKYGDFQSKLMPTIQRNTIIGVRTPKLRAYAKTLAAKPEAQIFLQVLPHTYYEENNLHGFLIESMKEYEPVLAALDAFLPYVDNWATCDTMRPRVFNKHLTELPHKLYEWLADGRTYTVRFAIEMLMTFYLDAQFQPDYLSAVAEIRSNEYYVNMMIAWFFATALAKQYDAALPYLEQHRLDNWTHNKAIRKAIESYRITDVQKAHLRSLKQPNAVKAN